ncbi:MAG: hypothetical protein HQL76_04785 [Magnetococcales bacterium]|nr:hypothetical protein [Magnetococcales bacterium]
MSFGLPAPVSLRRFVLVVCRFIFIFGKSRVWSRGLVPAAITILLFLVGVSLLPSGRVVAGQAVAQWRNMKGIAAVRNDRIHVFSEDYVVVPGPRFILILEKMAEAIHPEGE